MIYISHQKVQNTKRAWNRAVSSQKGTENSGATKRVMVQQLPLVSTKEGDNFYLAPLIISSKKDLPKTPRTIMSVSLQKGLNTNISLCHCAKNSASHLWMPNALARDSAPAWSPGKSEKLPAKLTRKKTWKNMFHFLWYQKKTSCFFWYLKHGCFFLFGDFPSLLFKLVCISAQISQ